MTSLGAGEWRRYAILCGVSAIVASELRKSYGNLVAVDDVSFDVDSGEFFGIIGPNGAGKTTTLEMIEGLRKPDRGKVTICGLASWPRNARLLPRIGVQLQASSFFERLTAREQIRTFAALYSVPGRRADELLGVVGLEDKADTRVEQLSGGQAQRLSLACTLAHDPEVVFLDEPTAALDPQARRNLWDLLRSINSRGRTVVLTTHYMDEADSLCDRVAIMDAGRILQCGPPATLVRGLDAPIRVSVVRGRLDDAALATLPAVLEAHDDGVSLTLSTRDPSVLLAELAARQALEGVQVKGATLEDLFLSLTGREYRE
jgi:ABC-2 type transport system ATP-binding protein